MLRRSRDASTGILEPPFAVLTVCDVRLVITFWAMSDNAIQNVLYLAVLPLIRIADSSLPVEEFMTLYPDKNFATSFFADEIGFYKQLILKRVQNLKGGHVAQYAITTEDADDGRQIIKVIQVLEGR
jgi:hypothetical protein